MERYKRFEEVDLKLTTSEQKSLKQQIKNWIDTFDNDKVEHKPGLSSLSYTIQKHLIYQSQQDRDF